MLTKRLILQIIAIISEKNEDVHICRTSKDEFFSNARDMNLQPSGPISFQTFFPKTQRMWEKNFTKKYILRESIHNSISFNVEFAFNTSAIHFEPSTPIWLCPDFVIESKMTSSQEKVEIKKQTQIESCYFRVFFQFSRNEMKSFISKVFFFCRFDNFFFLWETQ